MNVLVNGIGNIGTTLINVLLEYKEMLQIDNIYAFKNTAVTNWNSEEIAILEKKGLIVYKNDNKTDKIELFKHIDYIFDCTASGMATKNKALYASLQNLKACSAQGSEISFGLPFMSGIDCKLDKNDKFVTIVSCNTHAIGSIINSFGIDNIEDADFVIIRRSEDISKHNNLVGADVVSRHDHPIIGTHHAKNIEQLLLTKNISIPIQVSCITSPTQLMHSLRFNLKLKSPFKQAEYEQKLSQNSYITTTNKFDTNKIFDLGRRYGFNGRIYSHSIINTNNLLISHDHKTIKGWAFAPQEANTIVSTIEAFGMQMEVEVANNLLKALKIN